MPLRTLLSPIRRRHARRWPLAAALLLLGGAAPAQAVELDVNFQPAGAVAPAGYSGDSGEAFSSTRGYGWVRQDSLSGVHQPLSIVGNGRERNLVADQRLDTFMHMQYGAATNGVAVPAAWEATVPNGSYDVTVGVGDPSYFDSTSTVRIEGQLAVDQFQGATDSRFRFASRTITVSDGRLTVDALGGTNTKLTYLTVETAPVPPTGKVRPSADGPQPPDGSVGIERDQPISAETRLPNVGAGVDPSTLTAATVKVERVVDGAPVAGSRNTSGGGDVILFFPSTLLAKSTEYRVEITNGVKDLSGAPFRPLSWTFTTNAREPGVNTGASFTRSAQGSSSGKLSASLAIGPDNRLYATTLTGEIDRYPINADGSLGTPTVIDTVLVHEGGERHILGLAFDPASTATNPILWVSHSYSAIDNAPDWTGKISRLSGAGLATIQDYVTGLPRSVNDHETNSLAFGPDGGLYFTQGSNSAAGAPDTQWGNRAEHKLNAAVLKLDLTKLGALPLNAKTQDGGTYDPFAAGAPLTIYASGVRNAYDLVWHSNGELYSAVNGTAAHGNTPATPTTLPAVCGRRLDFETRGAWTGPAAPARSDIAEQPDLLLRVQRGAYYGHPNPSRCEYTFFGGNPTSATDPLELGVYPIGTPVDRNFRPPSYVFGVHYSPDGMIEYQSGAFGGSLKGRLLVTRYSGGKDIVALDVDPTTREIAQQQASIPGLTGLLEPLDLTEDTRSGNLYVSELGAARISLLRPNAIVPPTSPPPTSPAPTSPPPTSPTAPKSYRIDVGSSTGYRDAAGVLWQRDTGLYTPTNAASAGANGAAIANTTADPLYASYRGVFASSVPVANRTLSFALPISATKVNVRLLFAERTYAKKNRRLQNISIENQTRLTNYDIFKVAGGRDVAHDEVFNGVTVTGGVLNIVLAATKDDPSLSGIAVTCAAGC